MDVHRFDAVAHQVDQHLLNLDTIERHERQIAFDVGIDTDTTPRGLLGHEVQRFGYGATERRRASGLRGLLEHGADAAHDIGGGVGVTDDPLGRDLRALEVRGFRGQPPVAGVGVGDDRGQRLVHLVGDRSREFREAGGLCRLGELVGGLSQRLFGAQLCRFRTLAFGQIEDVGDPLPGLPLEAGSPDQHGHPAAILPEILLLAGLHLARPREFFSLFVGMHFLPFRRRDVEPSKPRLQILAVVLDHAEKRVIGVENPSVQIPENDPDNI